MVAEEAHGPEGPPQQLDGVPPLQMDVDAGVAALEAPQGHRECDAGGRGRRGAELDGELRVAPARAPDVEHAVLLGIEVDEPPPLHQSAVEAGGAGQPRLLVDGEQQLERPVRERRLPHHRQHRRHPDAVVRPQGGAGGGQVLALHPRHDGVGGEVERDVRVLLLHHVEVRLEDGDVGALVARRGRLAHDKVAGRVRVMGEPEAVGRRHDVIAHPAFILRRAGNRENGVEVPPQRGRLQVADEGHGVSRRVMEVVESRILHCPAPRNGNADPADGPPPRRPMTRPDPGGPGADRGGAAPVPTRPPTVRNPLADPTPWPL